jgi:SAM-dependent methyltransferase
MELRAVMRHLKRAALVQRFVKQTRPGQALRQLVRFLADPLGESANPPATLANPPGESTHPSVELADPPGEPTHPLAELADSPGEPAYPVNELAHPPHEEVGDGGERVTPDVPNDVFVAHLSLYVFAAQYARNGDVLDAGCGTGYGSHYFAQEGQARRVDAVDISPKAIAFCERRWSAPNLSFSTTDLAELERRETRYDFVYSSNVLEHVERLDEALAGLARLLKPDGTLFVAVPPVVTEEHLRSNFFNPYHINNFHPIQWEAKLCRFFESTTVYNHGVKPGVSLDFGRGEKSKYGPEDFTFSRVPRAELAERLVNTLTLVMICRRPLAQPKPTPEASLTFPMSWDIEAIWRSAETERRKVFEATGRGAQYDDAEVRRRVYPIRALATPSGKSGPQVV